MPTSYEDRYEDEERSRINVATVLASAGVAAVVSALIVTIGVVGLVATRDHSSSSAAQPPVINLGSPQSSSASLSPPPGAPGSSSALPPVADGGVPSAGGIAGPPAADPDGGRAGMSTTATRTSPPAAAQVQDAAAQNQTASIAASRTEYLTVRSDRPTPRTMEWQFVSFWNPRIPSGPKLAATYRGNTAKVREEVGKVMQFSQTYDFFSIRGTAIGAPQISGNQMTVTFQGVMAGFPIQTLRYHYMREDGLWKLDWKKICQDSPCAGNPNFGY